MYSMNACMGSCFAGATAKSHAREALRDSYLRTAARVFVFSREDVEDVEEEDLEKPGGRGRFLNLWGFCQMHSRVS
jgi:hypothetical protein